MTHVNEKVGEISLTKIFFFEGMGGGSHLGFLREIKKKEKMKE